MRIADLESDDKARQATPFAEQIAQGAGSSPINIPVIPLHSGTSVASPSSATSSILADDDEDYNLESETSPFYIDDAIDYHSKFTGLKKPKQPSTAITKAPALKNKQPQANTPQVVLDDKGNAYEYLGMFDGDLSFLDERYKVQKPVPGAHLYRRETGVQFAGNHIEYEYFIGDHPDTSAIFGKLFKAIGKGIKKVGKFARKTFFGKRPNRSVNAASFLINRPKATAAKIEQDGDVYEYVGQSNGSTSFLEEPASSIIVPYGAHLYRVQRTAGYDGVAEFDYYIGEHPDYSNKIGNFFKRIGRGVGKALKWAGNAGLTALPYVSPVGYGAYQLGKSIFTRRNNDFSGFTGVEKDGDFYEYVGQTNGDTSFLDEKEPDILVPFGSHLYRVQRTESFDGDNAEFDYYIGAHPEYSNSIGSFFKKIGKAIGKVVKGAAKGVGNAVKAVGKGIGNAAKFTVKKVIPLLTGAQMAQSNGETTTQPAGPVPTYNPTAGFEHIGANGSYGEADFGDGAYNEQTGSASAEPNYQSNVQQQRFAPAPFAPAPAQNKTLIYVAIGVAVLAAVIYLKKK